MRHVGWRLVALAALCVGAVAGVARAQESPLLHKTRVAKDDLEIGGELVGVPKGETRFVSWSELEKLPQETYSVSDDTNFVGTVTITGVSLEKLPGLLGAAPEAGMVIAVCDDAYEAHYPAAYLKAHHPVLVLRVNGQRPEKWPLGADGYAMGPYMVSHAKYTPSFKVLAHVDEPQVPWGLVRLMFRREGEVYGPIQPKGSHAKDELVAEGYTIARQNCFRCHATGGEGGTKSDRTWGMVARRASTDPAWFDAFVRNPKKVDPSAADMAASPQYDDATMKALRAYFVNYLEGAR